MACGKRGVRNLCGETRHLMGRIGVQIPAQPVSFNGNIPRAPVPGAFEDSVFDKVADSV